MPILNIRKLLTDSAELSALHKNTRRLLMLQKAYVDFTPVELASASRVGYRRADTLYLLADNAAVAAKLKQLLPRLLPKFQKLEPQVTVIRVELQVKTRGGAPAGRSRDAALSLENIKHFEDLAKQVSDPRLRSALAGFGKKRVKPD